MLSSGHWSASQLESDRLKAQSLLPVALHGWGQPLSTAWELLTVAVCSKRCSSES